MSSELLNQAFQIINTEVLQPLNDLESDLESIVEYWCEKLNVPKPRLVITLNKIDECLSTDETTSYCREITGKYLPENMTIIMNYISSIETLIHLYTHHIHACEVGLSRYLSIRRNEEIKLPWELRPTEIYAVIRSRKLSRELIDDRIVSIWNRDVKPKIKKLHTEVTKVRSMMISIIKNVLTRQKMIII